MWQKQISIILIFSCLAIIFSFNQKSIAQAHKNQVRRLREDFKTLRNTLENNYPSLYRYSSKKEMNALLDSCYASLNQNTSDFEFYKMLKFLLSAIKDGHLYCGLPPAEQTYVKEKAEFFPLKLRFIGNRAYVTSSVNNEIPAGSEIISINDLSIDIITNKLFPYIVSDGNIQTKKYHILNNVFYFYYFIVFGEKRVFEVKFKPENGSIRTKKINAELEKDIIKNNEKENQGKLLQFYINSDHIAIMTIKTFIQSQLKRNNEDFIQFLQSSFKKIRDQKIKKLIIDLRRNGGGRDIYGSLLYSYLAKKPFPYYKSLETATKDLPYERFRKGVSSYNNLNPKMLKRIGKNRFQLKNEAHPNLQILQPAQYNYTGKVWFLINGLSFSTTAEFCAVAYSHKRGKFIGEETGGAYYGDTSGMEIKLTLPNTKINVFYGTVEYKTAVKKVKYKARGTIPDYKIQPTVNDIMNKQDVQLAYALKIAKQR